MKIGIFYGSTTGQTEQVAQELAELMGVASADVHNVSETRPDAVADYDVLLFGTSTWGSGDLQDDWYDFIAGVQAMDLKGKKVAYFGVGDETMSDTFCSGVGELYRRMASTGATTIGVGFPTDVYDYSHTDAVTDDGQSVGLLIDNVNHADLTPGRERQWVEQIRSEM